MGNFNRYEKKLLKKKKSKRAVVKRKRERRKETKDFKKESLINKTVHKRVDKGETAKTRRNDFKFEDFLSEEEEYSFRLPPLNNDWVHCGECTVWTY